MKCTIFSVLLVLVFSLNLAKSQLEHLKFGPQPHHGQYEGSFFAAQAKPKSLDEAIKQQEAIIEQVKGIYGVPSMTFGFSVRGKTIMSKSWGESDIENHVQANTSTHYRLASISKTFTALYIGILVDQGKIKNFNDSIWDYISVRDFPKKSYDITVGQLLDHTAGLHSTSLADFTTLIHGINCTQVIHKFANEQLHFQPGADWLYSNYGYQLLGAIIESLTGKSYPEAMKGFFADLGLTETFVETTDLIVNNRPRYYMFPNNVEITRNIPTMTYDQLFVEEGWWPSGEIMSTVGDLLKYGQKILDAYKGRQGTMITKKTLDEIWTRRTANCPNFSPRPLNEYGYGFYIGHFLVENFPAIKHRNFHWHSGGQVGVTTFFMLYPEEEMVGVILANKGYIPSFDNVLFNAAETIYQFVPV